MKQENWQLKEIRQDVAELLARIDQLLKTDEDEDGSLPKVSPDSTWPGKYTTCWSMKRELKLITEVV